jgi:hypothetical protein
MFSHRIATFTSRRYGDKIKQILVILKNDMKSLKMFIETIVLLLHIPRVQKYYLNLLATLHKVRSLIMGQQSVTRADLRQLAYGEWVRNVESLLICLCTVIPILSAKVRKRWSRNRSTIYSFPSNYTLLR